MLGERPVLQVVNRTWLPRPDRFPGDTIVDGGRATTPDDRHLDDVFVDERHHLGPDIDLLLLVDRCLGPVVQDVEVWIVPARDVRARPVVRLLGNIV